MWGGTGVLGGVGNAIGCSRRSERCEGGCRWRDCPVLAPCETPKAAEPELTIGGEEAKAPARPRNLYGYVKKAWREPDRGVVQETHFQRMVEWRRGEAFVRLERPTRVDRARELGYRAKQGYVIVRARVRRGGRRRPKPMGGRHPKRRGLRKITMAKSIQRIAEERTARHYPNMEVLNSYVIGVAW